MKNINEISKAAATMGRKGGKSRSAAKVAAVRENGKMGGRPPYKTFHIYSSQGSNFGSWRGETPAHALSKMHRAAGYAVKWDRETDSILFRSDSDRELCGNVDSWHIV